MDSPIPMSFRIFIKGLEHDGQDHFHVVADKIAEVFIVPKIQCSLRNLEWVYVNLLFIITLVLKTDLKMRASNRLRQLLK